MDYVVEEKESRESPSARYFWIPGLLSFLLIASLILGRLFTKDASKFLSWNGVLTWCIVGVIVFFGVSLGIWFLLSLKRGKSGEREFLSRVQCDRIVKAEMKERYHYSLENFTATGSSGEFVHWLPEGIRDQADRDKIFGQLYRARFGNNWRYMLVCMNMEKGHQDDIVYRVDPMNYGNLRELFVLLGSGLCRNGVPKSFSQRTVRNEVTGISKEERVENPLDVPEDEDFDEPKQSRGVRG